MGAWVLILLSLALLSAVGGFEAFQDPQCYKNYIGPGSARDEDSPTCIGNPNPPKPQPPKILTPQNPNPPKP